MIYFYVYKPMKCAILLFTLTLIPCAKLQALGVVHLAERASCAYSRDGETAVLVNRTDGKIDAYSHDEYRSSIEPEVARLSYSNIYLAVQFEKETSQAAKRRILRAMRDNQRLLEKYRAVLASLISCP